MAGIVECRGISDTDIDIINYRNTGIAGAAQGYVGRLQRETRGIQIAGVSGRDYPGIGGTGERTGAAVAQCNLAIGRLQ